MPEWSKPDLRLRAYAEVVEKAHYKALQGARQQAGEDAWVDLQFPPVTLFVSGLIVSGRVVSQASHMKHVRNIIKTVSERTEEESFGGDVLAALFQDPPREYEEQVFGDDFTPRQIYLVDVVTYSGSQEHTMEHAIVELADVAGWTLGRADREND